MLHKEHGGAVFLYQPGNLSSGKNINIIHGLIPDVQMCLPAEDGRQQHLFLLAAAVVRQVPLKLLPGEVQLPQDGPEPAAVQPLLPGTYL